MHGALFSESPRPDSFVSVIETLRDAATLAIDENLGGDLFKSVQDSDRKKIMDRWSLNSVEFGVGIAQR